MKESGLTPDGKLVVGYLFPSYSTDGNYDTVEKLLIALVSLASVAIPPADPASVDPVATVPSILVTVRAMFVVVIRPVVVSIAVILIL